MAERRMFAKAITGSARFLRMPAASRLLYFDLGMEADDDGCVEAYCVVRKTGATEADLQTLADKGFIRILNDDLVSYIVDWRVNNQIRNDRYHAGIYKGLLDACLSGNQVTTNCQPDGNQLTTNCQPDGNQLTTEISIGQSSIVYDSTGEYRKKSTGFAPPTLPEVKSYIADNGFCVSADDFFNYYTSNGWTIRGVKMSDWQKIRETEYLLWMVRTEFATGYIRLTLVALLAYVHGPLIRIVTICLV